jgi:hypothetical protein
MPFACEKRGQGGSPGSEILQQHMALGGSVLGFTRTISRQRALRVPEAKPCRIHVQQRDATGRGGSRATGQVQISQIYQGNDCKCPT